MRIANRLSVNLCLAGIGCRFLQNRRSSREAKGDYVFTVVDIMRLFASISVVVYFHSLSFVLIPHLSLLLQVAGEFCGLVVRGCSLGNN